MLREAPEAIYEAFEELKKTFNLNEKKLTVSGDGKIFTVPLERDSITKDGFGIVLSGSMVGVYDHLNTLNISCSIVLWHVVPRMPLRSVTIRGNYYESWKLNYE
jgi:hypothetical protein